MKNRMLCLIILVVLLIFLPHIMRLFFGNSAIPGHVSYYHMRRAMEVGGGGAVNLNDSLVFGARPFSPSIYQNIVYIISLMLPVDFGLRVVYFCLGICSLFFYLLLLNRLGIDSNTRFLALLMLVISPAFLYVYTTADPSGMAIFLCIAGAYFFFFSGFTFFIVSCVAFMLSVMINVSNMVGCAIFLLVLLSSNWKLFRRYLAILAVIICTYVAYYMPFYLKYGFGFVPAFLQQNVLQGIVVDLGGMYGFSLFGIAISVIGVLASWKNKHKYAVVYVALFIYGVLSVWHSQFRIYLAFLLALMAAIGIKELFLKEWVIRLVRNITIPSLIIGLVVSTVSYVGALSVLGPNAKAAESLVWLKDNSDADAVVLSHYSYGFWIQGIAQRKVVMDEDFRYYNNLEKVYNDTQIMFSSRNLKYTDKLLWDYNITYIWINDDMRQGLVWQEDEEGLLFLFRNNLTFKKVFENDEVQVWEHIRVEEHD